MGSFYTPQVIIGYSPKNFLRNIFILTDGSVRTRQPADANTISRTILGGHESPTDLTNDELKNVIYDTFPTQNRAVTQSDYENDDFFKIYIDYPRVELIKRINVRTEDMIENGAISEVKKFIRLKVPRVKTASKAIGIAEIREYLEKKIEISEVIEKISIKTRQYAKRQSTWGRGNMMDWNKIKSEDLNKFLKKI